MYCIFYFPIRKLWNVWPSRREHIFHLVTNPWNLVESVVYHLFLYYLHKNICNGFAIALPIPFCLYKLYINVEPFSNQEKTDRELKEGSLTQHRNVKTRWIWKAPIAYNMEIMCTEYNGRDLEGSVGTPGHSSAFTRGKANSYVKYPNNTNKGISKMY